MQVVHSARVFQIELAIQPGGDDLVSDDTQRAGKKSDTNCCRGFNVQVCCGADSNSWIETNRDTGLRFKFKLSQLEEL